MSDFKPKPKAYVAGPYTIGDTAQHVKKAIETGNGLADAGFSPFIPHLSHFWHMQFPQSYEFWCDWCNQYLITCDIVFRLPGESKGTDAEVALAEERGIPVVENVETAVEWKQNIYGKQASGKDILTTAHALINGDRKAEYGHAAETFEFIARGFTWWMSDKLKDGVVCDRLDVAQFNSIQKKGRSKYSRKLDNYIDDAGYIGTIGQILDYEDDNPPTLIDSAKYGG